MKNKMRNTNKNNGTMHTAIYELSWIPSLNNGLFIMIQQYNINNSLYLENNLSRSQILITK